MCVFILVHVPRSNNFQTKDHTRQQVCVWVGQPDISVNILLILILNTTSTVALAYKSTFTVNSAVKEKYIDFFPQTWGEWP